MFAAKVLAGAALMSGALLASATGGSSAESCIPQRGNDPNCDGCRLMWRRSADIFATRAST